MTRNLELYILPEGAGLASHWRGSARPGRESHAHLFPLEIKPLADSKEIIHRQLNVAQDRAQKTGPDRFTGMYRHCRYSPIGMLQKKVAASCPHNLKAEFFEETHQFLAF